MNIVIIKGQEAKTKIVQEEQWLDGPWPREQKQRLGCIALNSPSVSHGRAAGSTIKLAQGFVTWTNSPEKEFKARIFINKALSLLFITIWGIILEGECLFQKCLIRQFFKIIENRLPDYGIITI